MNRPDHSTYREWLNLETDGIDDDLAPAERDALERHLASCPECRAERQELAALRRLLERSSLPVRPDFRDSVMAALPDAGWEARHPRTWRFPAAVVLLLGGLAAFLLGANLTQGGPAASGLQALEAVFGMLGAALQTGAGLIAASWSGAHLVMGHVFSSPMSLAVLGFLVLCLNLLFFSLLRRRRPSTSEVMREVMRDSSR